MTTTEEDWRNLKPLLETQQTKLALHAEKLVSQARERDWMGAMRDMAIELEIEDVTRDADLQAYLDAAERRQEKGTLYKGGEVLTQEEPTFFLDGLLHLGEVNFLIGQPKIGKSSFSCGLIAALRDRRDQFLGRDLLLPNERMPVLIFGTDQSEGNWQYYLRREGLINDAKVLDPKAIDVFCAADTKDEFNFSKDGIRHMREVIEQYQFPLVIIDSLSSMMEATDLDENLSKFAKPIRAAANKLSTTGATILILHHTKKSPTTWDWVSECRGSSSISSIPSWGVLMRWVRDEDAGLARTDKRVGFTASGRGHCSHGGILAQYHNEGNWKAEGCLEEAQHVELIRKKMLGLGGVRGEVFDYLKMRSELGADVSAEEIGSSLQNPKPAGNASRELLNLRTMGLARVVRSEPTGGRPRLFWKVSESVLAAVHFPAPEADFFDTNDNKYLISKISNISTFREGEQPSKESTPPRTPVELFRNGEWANGYVIRDASNPEAITVEKLGNPAVTISNLRYGIDLRPCSAPFGNTPTETVTVENSEDWF